MSWKSVLKTVTTDVKNLVVDAVKNPAKVKKALAAALTNAGLFVTAFAFVFPEVSTAHAALFTTASTVISYVLTYLAPGNKPVAPPAA